MDELEKLEYLSLVSKVCMELENHLGLNDKDLADFVIALAEKNKTFDKKTVSCQLKKKQTKQTHSTYRDFNLMTSSTQEKIEHFLKENCFCCSRC